MLPAGIDIVIHKRPPKKYNIATITIPNIKYILFLEIEYCSRIFSRHKAYKKLPLNTKAHKDELNEGAKLSIRVVKEFSTGWYLCAIIKFKIDNVVAIVNIILRIIHPLGFLR